MARGTPRGASGAAAAADNIRNEHGDDGNAVGEEAGNNALADHNGIAHDTRMHGNRRHARARNNCKPQLVNPRSPCDRTPTSLPPSPRNHRHHHRGNISDGDNHHHHNNNNADYYD